MLRKIPADAIMKLVHNGTLRAELVSARNFVMDAEVATIVLGSGPWNAEQLEQIAGDLRALEKLHDNGLLEYD